VDFKIEGKFVMAELKLVGKPGGEHSPMALTFNAEIKRLAIEKGIEIGKVMTKLAEFAGLDERHLYNYRSGKTDIPSMLIPVFCKQFQSNALAMTLVGLCDVGDFEDRDNFDLSNFCADTVSNMLAGGQTFINAARDGRIDGHELIEIKNTSARIIRDAHRIVETATQLREARCA